MAYCTPRPVFRSSLWTFLIASDADDSLNPEPTDMPSDPAAEPVSPTNEPRDPLPEDEDDPEMPDPTETDE